MNEDDTEKKTAAAFQSILQRTTLAYTWPLRTFGLGTTMDAVGVFEDHDCYFDDISCSPMTSVHSYICDPTSASELDSLRETIASSATTEGICHFPSCPLRPEALQRGKVVYPNLQTCSRCRMVFYCGTVCQKADWPAHKQKCTLLAVSGDSKVAPLSEAALTFSTTSSNVALMCQPLVILHRIWLEQSEGFCTPEWPPMVHIELCAHADGTFTPPLAWRASMYIPHLSEILERTDLSDSNVWLDKATTLPTQYLSLIKGNSHYSKEILDGERIPFVVTTTARDPKRIKIITLRHNLPQKAIAARLKRIYRAARDKRHANNDTAELLIKCTHLVARPADCEEDYEWASKNSVAHAAIAFGANRKLQVDSDTTPPPPMLAFLMSDTA